MATQLQIRRGTTSQMNAFTGAEGELAVNTTTDTVHVHDGSTAGGHALAKADGSNIATYAGSFTTIHATGNTGIGTGTTVNRKLEVAGNNNGGAKANYIRITDTDTSATANNQAGGIEFFTNDVTAGIAASMEVLYAGSGGGGEITFNTNASSSGTLTEAMRINESGSVGIGTSLPVVKLAVKSSQEQLTLSEGDARGATFDYRSSTGNLNIATNGANARTNPQFTLDLNGNVGIGRNPSERLDVDGVIQINRTGDHPAMRFMEDGTTRAYLGSGDWAVTGGVDADFGISSVGNLLFGTSAGQERLRIDSGGSLTGTCINATTGEYDGSLDDLKKTGFYRSKNSNTNNPSFAYYSVVVYGNQGNVTAQIATLLAGPATYVRSFNVSWTSWVRIDD